MHCVLVTGYREWFDEGFIAESLAKLEPFDWLMHGGATGADELAGKIATRMGKHVWSCPALWDFYRANGNYAEAGPRRNAAMVELLTFAKTGGLDVTVAAFPTVKSKGTFGCMNLARMNGLKVINFTDGESP